MIYLTVNDAPSGVYKSQVIDVINELNMHVDQPVRLIAFISFRNFSENKRTILKWYPTTTVKMMLPGLKNWKKNKLLLRLISGMKRESILARGPMAFWLAAQLNKNVSYDGRGAVKAELIEFPGMIPDKQVVNSIIEAEELAVLQAKFRIAVSNKLVDYWRNEYGYEKDDHVVIPCTVSHSVETDQSSKQKLLKELGWKQSDIILIYSGSVAGWQSFDKIQNYLVDWIENQDVKVLFLAKDDPVISQMTRQFPNNIRRIWLEPKAVVDYLSIGDYGILIREENMTNRVASPVKFAEYLAVGIQVLISPELGDYSALVTRENLGFVIENRIIHLLKTSEQDKQRLMNYANNKFRKESYRNQYIKVLKSFNG